jgi:adenosylcobinamide-phosphate synthase
MGDGRNEATPADIERALALYTKACFALWLLVGLLAGVAVLLSD